MDRAVACPLLGRGPRKRSAMVASRVALGGAWGTLAHTGLPSKGVKSDSSAAEDTEVPLGKTGGGVQNFLRGWLPPEKPLREALAPGEQDPGAKRGDRRTRREQWRGPRLPSAVLPRPGSQPSGLGTLNTGPLSLREVLSTVPPPSKGHPFMPTPPNPAKTCLIPAPSFHQAHVCTSDTPEN